MYGLVIIWVSGGDFYWGIERLSKPRFWEKYENPHSIETQKKGGIVKKRAVAGSRFFPLPLNTPQFESPLNNKNTQNHLSELNGNWDWMITLLLRYCGVATSKPAPTRSKRKRRSPSEEGVAAANRTFAKILEKADPKAKSGRR